MKFEIPSTASNTVAEGKKQGLPEMWVFPKQAIRDIIRTKPKSIHLQQDMIRWDDTADPNALNLRRDDDGSRKVGCCVRIYT